MQQCRQPNSKHYVIIQMEIPKATEIRAGLLQADA
jgi:hypothetical protein